MELIKKNILVIVKNVFLVFFLHISSYFNLNASDIKETFGFLITL